MSTGQNSHDHEKDNVWAEFVATHGPGTAVRGLVSQVNPHGITVRIVPGVMGFVPIEEIATYTVDEPQDTLWPDDIVEAIVTDVEPSTKRVGLSIRQLVSQRAGRTGSAVSPSEREQFWATTALSKSFRPAICPDVSQWPLGSVLEPAYKQGPLSERLSGSLQALCQETNSMAAAVIRLDPDTETVALVVTVGMLASESADMLRHLRFSPLEEIWRGQTVVDNKGRQQETAKFRFLLRFLDFDACMGVPIVVEGRIDHALLLFGRGVEYGDQAVLAAAVSSTLISVLLEKSRAEEELSTLQQLSLLALLSSTAFHEVSNRLSATEFYLDNLHAKFRSPEMLMDLTSLNEGLLRVAQDIHEVKRIMAQYLELGRVQETEAIEVSSLLETIAQILKPLTRRERIQLSLELTKGLLPVVGVKRHLEQACLNLVLHAIRQAAYNPHGSVSIKTDHSNKHLCPIQIRVTDNGPGIHRRAWDRIFELGYTTQPDDSGLGLYIARSMVESLSGRLFVEDSIMFLGSTFLMQLPAMAAS